MAAPVFTTGELAGIVDARLIGSSDVTITGLGSLAEAGPSELSHLSAPAYRHLLAASRAGAVLVRGADAVGVSGCALVVSEPYLAYARISRLFHRPHRPHGLHPAAQVADSAELGPDVAVAAGAVVDDTARLGARCVIHAGAVVGAGVVLGDDCEVHAAAVLCAGVQLGARVIIHPGAVIGADGFGFARGPQGVQERIAQLGSVRLGDDVEVGANSTIDRGALQDTVIEHGVKIDNQVQIGHNVHVGHDTVICGCTGIVGSTRIGARCVLAGGVGVGGDGPISICDDVIVSGMTHVSRSIDTPGQYSSGTLHAPSTRWKRNAVRFGELDALAQRVRELERRLPDPSTGQGAGPDADGEDKA